MKALVRLVVLGLLFVLGILFVASQSKAQDPGTPYFPVGTSAITYVSGAPDAVPEIRIDDTGNLIGFDPDEDGDSDVVISVNGWRQISGTALPGTCSVGDTFVDTDADTDGSLFFCRATNVWKDVDDDGSTSGGAPTTVDYLVGTADGVLSAEIVVGTNPGGELGGTWASPTIDDTLSVSNWSLTTPKVLGKYDLNDTAVDDDDCTGDQGIGWYDSVDARWEFCNANSGIPTTLTDAPSGDVGAVGNCSDGLCFDGTSDGGSSLTFYNAAGNSTLSWDGSAILLSAGVFAGVLRSPTGDSADFGAIRFANAAMVCWETSPTGTDVCLQLDTANRFNFGAPLVVDASDPADSGAIRLDNLEGICWEGSPTGSDVCLYADTNEALTVTGGTFNLTNPVLQSKIDTNNAAVSDDDCTGEQGLFWYDSTDARFEFCNANSGVPDVMAALGYTLDLDVTGSGAGLDPIEITESETLNIDCGTGLDCGTATDNQLDVDLDFTEINDVTFGSGTDADVRWTINRSGVDDHFIQFSANEVRLGSTGFQRLALVDADTEDDELAAAFHTYCTEDGSGIEDCLLFLLVKEDGIDKTVMTVEGITGVDFQNIDYFGVTTDGTGDAEVNLPTDSIGAAELGPDSVGISEHADDSVGINEIDLISGDTPVDGDCLIVRPGGTGGTIESGSCSAGAPTGSSYVTLGLDGGLSAERVLTDGATGIDWNDTGANGTITASFQPGELGNLTFGNDSAASFTWTWNMSGTFDAQMFVDNNGEFRFIGETPLLGFVDTSTTDDKRVGRIWLECSDGATGAEDCDLLMEIYEAGTPKTVLTFDADGGTLFSGTDFFSVVTSGSGDTAVQLPSGSIGTPELTATAARRNCDWIVQTPVTGENAYYQCYIPDAATLVRVVCSTEDTDTVTVNLYSRAEASPNSGITELLTADLVCDTSPATACSSGCDTTIADDSLDADTLLTLHIAAIGGTPDVGRVHVEYTVN